MRYAADPEGAPGGPRAEASSWTERTPRVLTWRTIASTVAQSVITATTTIASPHRGQTRGSTSQRVESLDIVTQPARP